MWVELVPQWLARIETLNKMGTNKSSRSIVVLHSLVLHVLCLFSLWYCIFLLKFACHCLLVNDHLRGKQRLRDVQLREPSPAVRESCKESQRIESWVTRNEGNIEWKKSKRRREINRKQKGVKTPETDRLSKRWEINRKQKGVMTPETNRLSKGERSTVNKRE